MIHHDSIDDTVRKLILEVPFETVISVVDGADSRFALTMYSNHHYTFTMVCEDGLLSVDLFPSDGVLNKERSFDDYFTPEGETETEEVTSFGEYTSVIVHPYEESDDSMIDEFVTLLESHR